MSSIINLFEPGAIGPMALSNRIVMAPMTRSRANEDAVPSGMMVTYYEQRASAGLIISEGTIVSGEATGYIKVPGLFTPEQVASWRPITDAVHAKGGHIITQLWHVGRVSHPDLLDGALPLAPSAINPEFEAYTRNGRVPTVTPRAMTPEDINRTIEDFRKAAVNAMAAGFDGVELHAANTYLFHQFLVPSANQRTDEYGSTIENRARFLLKVVDTVAEAIGIDRVGVRMNPCVDGPVGIILDTEAQATYEYVIRELSTRKVAFLHLAALMFVPGLDSEDRTLEMARCFRPLFSGPLIINGAMTRDAAEYALREGIADYVAFGKDFIANPDLVYRLKKNVPLTEPDPNTFYEGGTSGYIDYKTVDDAATN